MSTEPGSPEAVERIREMLAEQADEDVSDPKAAGRFVLAFSFLSFVGTFVGLREIVHSGDVPEGWLGAFLTDVVLFILVALATLAMVEYLRRFLRKPFSRLGAASALVYVLLLVFSVTFGFAFYWRYIEARTQSIDNAEEQLSLFNGRVSAAAQGLGGTIESMNLLSQDFQLLAAQEERIGGTCGDGSGSGPGPRMRHRYRRAAEINADVGAIGAAYARIAPGLARLEAFAPQLDALREDKVYVPDAPIVPDSVDGAAGDAPASAIPASAASDASLSPSERRERVLFELRREAITASVNINSLAQDPVMREVSARFGAWAEEYRRVGMVRTDDPLRQSYVCFSFEAAGKLETASSALSSLPTVEVPDLPSYAGPRATRAAVDRMFVSLAGLVGLKSDDARAREQISSSVGTGGLSPNTEAGVRQRAASANAAGAGQGPVTDNADAPTGLRERDRFPLFVALIVDTLLFFSALAERRPSSPFSHLIRRVREAIREKVNPLHILFLRQQMEDHPAWQKLRRFRFFIEQDEFYVSPPDMSIEHAPIVRDVLNLWIRLGIARSIRIDFETVRARLQSTGSTELLAALEAQGGGDNPDLLIVRMIKDQMTLALLNALLVGVVPGPRDVGARPSNKPLRSGVSGALLSTFQAAGVGAERRLHKLADRLRGTEPRPADAEPDWRPGEERRADDKPGE